MNDERHPRSHHPHRGPLATAARLLAAGVCLWGCSSASEPSPGEPSGLLTLALRTENNGVVYRLRDAVFQVTGPQSVMLATEQQPDAAVLERTLRPGTYNVLLAEGWRLERSADTETGFEDVTAELTSPNPSAVVIEVGRSAPVRFQFLVRNLGRLAIGIDVMEEEEGDTGGGGSGGSGGPGACPAPAVELLVDHSGSMNEPFGLQDRASALAEALVGSDGVVTKLQDRIAFGATTFGYDPGTDLACPRMSSTATRALGNRDAIAGLLAGSVPAGRAPTADAIQRVIEDFQQRPPLPGSAPFIVLVTDGDPVSCASPDAADESARELAVRAASRAFDAGILTFVVGIGEDTRSDYLSALAHAGSGFNAMNAPDPAHLADALSILIGSTLGCAGNGAVAQTNALTATSPSPPAR